MLLRPSEIIPWISSQWREVRGLHSFSRVGAISGSVLAVFSIALPSVRRRRTRLITASALDIPGAGVNAVEALRVYLQAAGLMDAPPDTRTLPQNGSRRVESVDALEGVVPNKPRTDTVTLTAEAVRFSLNLRQCVALPVCASVTAACGS